MELPQDYIVFKFYQYCKDVQYNKFSNNYQGGCCICNEGTSFGKKKRCYYIPDRDLIYCFNCGWSSHSIKWIKEVTKDSYAEIYAEAEEFDLIPFETKSTKDKNLTKKAPSLPYDSINLFDSLQVNYHKNNSIVQKALDIIKHRRIDTAINKPKALWLSLKDSTHKNRLIIPFYDDFENVIFYQSRTILDTETKLPKYLCKKAADKSLYGLDSIDTSKESLFIFEGPINAFFVKNSTALCGIQENSDKTLTELQQQQLSRFKFLKKIWVLDSQWLDQASYKKTNRLISQGESVFIWPEKIGKLFKDFNDLCIHTKKDEVSENFILKNTESNLMAKLKMANINCWKK